MMNRSPLRPTAAIVAVTSATSLVACSGNGPGGAGSDSPDVLATFTIVADIAQEVAGDHLTVESLTRPGAEVHG